MSLSLPKPLLDLIEASQRGDAGAFLAPMADDAMISDRHRPFFGKAEIARWSDEEFIGRKVAIEEVTSVKDHHGDLIVNAWVSGSYATAPGHDRIELAFYVVIRGEKIVKIVILPAWGQGQERQAA